MIRVNLLHLVFRAVSFFFITFLIIQASHFAIKGQINFGIVISCMGVYAPLNCILSYIFWKESMTYVMLAGTFLIISGVTWLALAEGGVFSSQEEDLP